MSKDNKKILFIVGGVALAYVLVVTVGLGSSSDEGSSAPSSDDPDAVEQWFEKAAPGWLRSMDFLPKPKVSFDRAKLEVAKGKPAELAAVADVKKEYRQATFALVKGTPVQVQFFPANAQENDGKSVFSQTLQSGESQKFIVGKSGGRFRFEIVSSDTNAQAQIKIN